MLITWLKIIGFIAVTHYSVSITNIRKVHPLHSDNKSNEKKPLSIVLARVTNAIAYGMMKS